MGGGGWTWDRVFLVYTEWLRGARVMRVVGAIRSDSGLGMVRRSGRHWCAGIDRGAGSRLGTPG